MGNCPKTLHKPYKVTECDIKINNILLSHNIMQFQIIYRVRGSDHTCPLILSHLCIQTQVHTCLSVVFVM